MSPEPEGMPEPRKKRSLQIDGAAFLTGLFLGFSALWIVYLVIFYAAGAPYGHIGPYAFIPVGVYAAAAVILAARRRRPGMSIGGGMLLGLGIWLLVGGGTCIAGLSRTTGLL